MIVCSCNVITEKEISDVIISFLDEDEWQLVTPGKVYHAMAQRGRCCGCFPVVSLPCLVHDFSGLLRQRALPGR